MSDSQPVAFAASNPLQVPPLAPASLRTLHDPRKGADPCGSAALSKYVYTFYHDVAHHTRDRNDSRI